MSDNVKEAARELLNLKTMFGNGGNGQLSRSTETLPKLKALIFWMLDKAVTIVDVSSAKISDKPKGWIGRIKYSNGQYYDGKILEISRDTAFLEATADKFKSALEEVEAEIEPSDDQDDQSEQSAVILTKRIGRKKVMSDYVCDGQFQDDNKENDTIYPKSSKKTASVNQKRNSEMQSKTTKRSQINAEGELFAEISNMTPIYAIQDAIRVNADMDDYQPFPPKIQAISPTITTDAITPDETESEKIILDIGNMNSEDLKSELADCKEKLTNLEDLKSELAECKEKLAIYEKLLSATPQEINFFKRILEIIEGNAGNNISGEMEAGRVNNMTATLTTESPTIKNSHKIELLEGSGIFVTMRQKTAALIKGGKNPRKLVGALLETLYDYNQLSKLTTLGGNNSKQMQPGVLEAITAFVNQHSSVKLQRTEVVRVINMKSASVRRVMKRLSPNTQR